MGRATVQGGESRRIRLDVLGTLSACAGGRELALGGPKQRAVLAILVLHAGEVVPRDQLIAALWGEDGPAKADKTVQVYVSNLRKALGDGLLVTRGRGYLLCADRVDLDAHRFGVLADRGRRLLAAGDAAAARDTLDCALGLWRGEPLEDFTYEDFAQGEIVRLQEARLVATEDRIDARLALGEHAQLVGELGALVRDEPLRERVRAQLMVALYRCGRQAEALACYRELSAMLRDELGLAPSPSLQQLERSMLRNDPALTPTPVSSSARLPHPSTPFLGRDRELADAGALFRQPDVRLLTLTGAGGCGKTRFALQLARRSAQHYPDGVVFVSLADVDEELIAPTICRELGLAENTAFSPAEQLHERLAGAEFLLILDNCEHVVGAVAQLVASVLSGGPSASVLATSREPLRVDGEQVFRVPPMSLPSDSTDDRREIEQAEAVQLFVARARQQRPTFALDENTAAPVARICRKLDGLPMAIELAAVKVRSMSIVDLDNRLSDRFALLRSGARNAPARQQTLHGLIDWSYQLLSEPERLLLERLSVFPASGFELEAAHAICGADTEASSRALEDLDALVDKSLVQAEETFGAVRYRLLESVRAYASARLDQTGEMSIDATRTAHRRHYLALAESAEAHLRGPERRAWLARLANEQDNLRIAVDDCLRDPSPQPGLRFVDALRGFWQSWVPAAEASRLIARQLDRADAHDASLARGKALLAASQLCFRPLGDFVQTVAYAEQALEIGRRHHHNHLCADALRYLAWGELRRGQRAKSLVHSTEGLELARPTNDHLLLVELLIVRAAVLTDANDEARAHLLEAAQVAQAAGDPRLEAMSLGNLGYLDLLVGDPGRARTRLETTVKLLVGLDEVETVSALNNLGFATHLVGDSVAAASRFQSGLELARRLGDPEAATLALLGLAITSPEPTKGATLQGASDALLNRYKLVLDPLESELRDDNHGRLNEILGPDEFDHAYRAGQNHDPHTAPFTLSQSMQSHG